MWVFVLGTFPKLFVLHLETIQFVRFVSYLSLTRTKILIHAVDVPLSLSNLGHALTNFKNLLRFGIQADKNSAKSHYTQHSYWISVNLTNYWEYAAILSTKSLSISELTRLVIADVRLVTILWKSCVLNLDMFFVYDILPPPQMFETWLKYHFKGKCELTRQ